MTTEVKKVIDLGQSYTVEEFEALPGDGNRYELVRGKIVKMPSTGDEHGTILDELYAALRAYVKANKLGKLWFTTGFKLSDDTEFEPDLMFITADRVPPLSKKALRVIPDLVVEIWSPSQLTLKGLDKASQQKIQDYLEGGVRQVWSIHPENQIIEVYQQGQSAPVQVLGIKSELNGGEVIPGFRIQVGELFGQTEAEAAGA